MAGLRRWLCAQSARGAAALLAAAFVLLPRPVMAQEPLRFVGDRDYPPLSYLENGEPRGFDVDVVREVGRVLGRAVRVDLMEWADAQTAVLNGQAHGLTDLAISGERRELYEFAQSTVTHDFGLFIRAGDTATGTLSGVRGKSVGVTQGGFPREFFSRRPDVHVVVIDNYDEGFSRLLAGTLDAIAADVWVGASTVERRGLTGVALGGEPFASLPAAIAVRKGNAALIDDINRAIATLEASGRLDEIRDRWRPQEMVFLSRERYQNLLVTGIGGALALLLVATTAWALALRRQVRVRRTVEAELRESAQRLGLAVTAANMGTWRVALPENLDTRDANLNRILGLDAVESTNHASELFSRVHPDDRDGMKAEFEGAIRERRAYWREFRIVRPDGSIRWLRGRGKAFYDEGGAPEYITGVAIDITEEIETEERGRLLAHALQSANDCIIITDASGHIVYVNDAFRTTYGYAESEILGRHAGILAVTDATQPVLPEEADGWRGERMHVSKSGRVFPVSLATSLLRGSRGELSAIVSVARDMTTEKLAEDALRASEERFFKAFEASPAGIAIRDSESGALLMVNEAFERVTGYQRAELIGRTIPSLCLVGDTARSDPSTDGVLRADARDVEVQIRRKDGRAATLLVSTATIEIGGKPAVLSVCRDITERKRFDQHLRQASEVNRLLLSEMDLEELSGEVVEAAHKILPIEYASLVLIDAGSSALQLKAQRGLLDAGRTPAAGQAIAAATIATGRVQLLRPDDLEALSPAVRPLLASGLRSVCSLPLVTPRETVGVLNVGSVRHDAFSPDDVTLMQQLGTYVAIAIQNARSYDEIRTLKDQVSHEKLYLEEEIRLDHNFTDIIGESPAIKRVLQQIETVAPTSASVLILGETGTGKELLARALHQLSPRKDRTFVRVNAAALPTALLESELFGYERGAFTGATSSKVGRLELAHRGTLFLDEVGDVPLEVQPKLLRALQEREFERLGSTRTQQVDVRFIAATNRDLRRMVDDGTFRSDLFYRLNVFPLEVPPLRDRRDDIPLLVRHFVQRFAAKFKRPIDSIPAAAMLALQDWHWPGNIRELENVIERAVIVSTGTVLTVPAFQMRPQQEGMSIVRPTVFSAPLAEPSPASFADGERDIILRALRDTRGIVAGPEGAAAKLGIKRTTLQSKMRKLGIRRPSF